MSPLHILLPVRGLTSNLRLSEREDHCNSCPCMCQEHQVTFDFGLHEEALRYYLVLFDHPHMSFVPPFLNFMDVLSLLLTNGLPALFHCLRSQQSLTFTSLHGMKY